MSRLVTMFGLCFTLFAACSWADCKQDAKAISLAGAEATADCSVELASDTVSAVHDGRAGWLDDIFRFVGDAVCLATNLKRHLAVAHSCADASSATCTTAISAEEIARVRAAVAILKTKSPTDGGAQ